MALDFDTTRPLTLGEIIEIGELLENGENLLRRAKAAVALLVSRSGLSREQVLGLDAKEAWAAVELLIENLAGANKLRDLDCGEHKH